MRADITDPRLYALTLATALDELARKLANLAGYGTAPETEPLPDPDAFRDAENRGLIESLVRVEILTRHRLGESCLGGTGWGVDSLIAVVTIATLTARGLIEGLGRELWGAGLGRWPRVDLDRLCYVVGAAALLRDLARELERKAMEKG